MNTVVAPVSLLNSSKLRRRHAATNGNASATAKKLGGSGERFIEKCDEFGQRVRRNDGHKWKARDAT